MFGQNVLEAGPRHCGAFSVHKQFRCGDRTAHGQPATEVGGGFLPERKGSLSSTLSLDADARGPLQRQVRQRNADEFRDAETGCEAEVKHRAVAEAEAHGHVRRADERADLSHRKVPHERLVVALIWDGVDLPDLRECGGYAELDVSLSDLEFLVD